MTTSTDLRPPAVAEVPEQHAADRPRHEADHERRERQQRADRGGEVREELLVEHQRGRGAVDEEVVPLDGGAGEARRDRPVPWSGVGAHARPSG
ncbi:hypothetical protein [Actinomadura sp. RB99]|uniref:hypothetical protein n=1 Tax=Actinomadura sp. RB99 TaxID=2691577 RepID=UPI0019D58AF1|nr:hypothetical protein [Actinomadura sp. RB99]